MEDLRATPRIGGLDADGLLRAAPEALLLVQDGVVTWANDRATSLVGADPSGRPVAELVSGWRGTPEDAVPFDAAIVASQGELPVEVRVSPVGPDATSVIVAIRDARQLMAGREAVTAMEEAEAKYQTLVEQIPAIVYMDVEGRGTTYVSPQIERILGVRARRVLLRSGGVDEPGAPRGPRQDRGGVRGLRGGNRRGPVRLPDVHARRPRRVDPRSRGHGAR